jgi:hypothetical protein
MDIFISIPFAPAFTEVSRAVSEVALEKGLATYRVDQDLLAKHIPQMIDRKIRESRIVVADITGSNPNVLHELGQAQSLGKPLVIISQDKPQTAPFNVSSLRINSYDPHKLADLRQTLKLALSEATSPNETLRAMLVPVSLGLPTKESRFVIVASPLPLKRAMGRSGGCKKMRRTYSDYVGIRGILQAFGLLYGFDTLPDLIDSKDYDDTAMVESMNMYCIASPKANRWTATLLQQYHQNYVPRIEYRADSTSLDLGNVKVSIYSDDALLTPPGWKPNVENDRHSRDFGLIIRGPNPLHHDRMVAIIAGRSSLGTEAACRAYTNVDVITKIRNRLAGMQIDMEDHEQGFWALVSIERAIGDGKEEAIPESLRVHQVDKFHRI